ncbi:MAG: lysylphosphatidylglycerol synthase transmembrane domain-containing protein [Aquabacterium sp.]|nr:lysylphosphatidylglycerol synthase transmembrane domain-containing protein [Aquabacterium sp.]
MTDHTTASQHIPTKTGTGLIKKVLAWAIGLVLLTWLLGRTPFEQVWQAFARPTWVIWALTLGGILTSYGLRAARLQIILNLDGHTQAPHRWLGLRTDALRVILMHNAAINLLPMRAGELSFPWLAHRELGMPVARAVACLLWMRVQDVVVLIVLGVVLWPGIPLGLRLAALAGLVMAWRGLGWLSRWWLGRHIDVAQDQKNGRFSRKLSHKFSHLMSRLKQAMLEPEHHHPLAWLATLSNWSLKLAAGACLLSSVSTAPWMTAWAGALGGELAAIVPLQGPAGFGTYEAGVWAGMASQLPPHSEALSHAISAALALHVCFLLCAVLAGALATVLSWANKPASPQGTPHSRHPG